MLPGTLLIVEDEEDLRDLLFIIAKRKVEKVITAENGQEALEHLSNQKVDIVMSDICMPIMTGIQLFNEMKSNDEYKEIPFMFLSAYSNTRESKEVQDKAFKFIGKPFDRMKLLTSITEAFLSIGQGPIEE